MSLNSNSLSVKLRAVCELSHSQNSRKKYHKEDTEKRVGIIPVSCYVLTSEILLSAFATLERKKTQKLKIWPFRIWKVAARLKWLKNWVCFKYGEIGHDVKVCMTEQLKKYNWGDEIEELTDNQHLPIQFLISIKHTTEVRLAKLKLKKKRWSNGISFRYGINDRNITRKAQLKYQNHHHWQN